MLEREPFAAVYSDLLLIAELHRNDTTGYRNAIDSLFAFHETDSASVIASARWYAEHHKELAPVFDETLQRLEMRIRQDSATASQK